MIKLPALAFMDLRKNAVFYSVILLIALLGVGTRAFLLIHKEFMHLDEAASMAIANVNTLGFSEYYAEGVPLTGDDLRREAFAVKPGVGGVVQDVLALRKDNNDPPHTNLYYSLLRVALLDIKSWDMRSLVWRGGLLNILFFCLGFGVLYRLGQLLLGEARGVQVLALLALSVNPAALSSALFVRPYELQSALFTLATLITLRYLQRMEDRQPCPEYGSFFLHSAGIALCLLSGYFALFYVALLGMLLLLVAWRKKMKQYIPYFMALLALALVMCWSFYSSFMAGLFVDRGTEATQKATVAYLLGNATYLVDRFAYLYGRFVIAKGGIAALVLGVGFSRAQWWQDQRTQWALQLLVVAFLWSFLAFTLAPYKTLRYFMPAVPVVLLCVCTAFLYGRFRKALMAVFAASCLVMPFFRSSLEQFYLDYVPLPATSAPYVFSPSSPWRVTALLPYIGEQQHIVAYHSCESLRQKYMDYPGSYLITDKVQIEQCKLMDWPHLRKVEEQPVYTFFLVGEP